MSDESRLMVLRVVHEQLSGKMQPHEAWTQQQWKQSFDFIFTDGTYSGIDSTDDLLFFVHSPRSAMPPLGQLNDDGNSKEQLLDIGMPYSVRRRGQPLPPSFSLSGPLFPLISWTESFLLNLVMNCQYSLTVTTCPRDSLGLVAAQSSAGDGEGGIRSITRRVFASTTQTSVNLRDKDAKGDPGHMRLCYPPDVCFAVESFDEDFSEMVLRRNEASCFCVSLSMGYDHLISESGARGSSRQAIVFSGFVSYEQVCHQMERQMERTLSFSGRGQRRERVLMAGPGGVGLAEVAVTLEEGGSGGAGPVATFFNSLTRILTENVSFEALQAPPLQCSLMSMRLPVDSLARMIIEASVGLQ